MITDIFLRTYPGDYQWLPYLFRSIDRHVHGFRNIVVVHPRGTLAPTDCVPYDADKELANLTRFVEGGKYENDYIGQQIDKLRATEFTDAEQICYVDSDIVFRSYLNLGKKWGRPIYYADWDKVGNAICWKEPTEKLLGSAPFETMRDHPFVYPAWLIKETLDHVGGADALEKCGLKFSEFNLLGNYARLTHPEKFEWQDVGVADDQTSKPRARIVDQFWSWGGITPEVKAKMRAHDLHDPTVRASALIRLLQAAMEEHGDLQVLTEGCDCWGVACEVKKVEKEFTKNENKGHEDCLLITRT